jgi:DNA-binding MarR family transcriptional regulator
MHLITNTETKDSASTAAGRSLSNKTLLNILYTKNKLAERFNEILKQYDLSSEQFHVLCLLRDQKGKAVNLNVIQGNMIAKTSNTSRLVDKLLLKDLVLRKVCAENRRKIEVSITKKGLSQVAEIEPKIIRFEEYFANNLTQQELKNLNFLLDKYSTIKV